MTDALLDELTNDTWLPLGSVAKSALARLVTRECNIQMIILIGETAGIVFLTSDGKRDMLCVPVETAQRILMEAQNAQRPKPLG